MPLLATISHQKINLRLNWGILRGVNQIKVEKWLGSATAPRRRGVKRAFVGIELVSVRAMSQNDRVLLGGLKTLAG